MGRRIFSSARCSGARPRGWVSSVVRTRGGRRARDRCETRSAASRRLSVVMGAAAASSRDVVEPTRPARLFVQGDVQLAEHGHRTRARLGPVQLSAQALRGAALALEAVERAGSAAVRACPSAPVSRASRARPVPRRSNLPGPLGAAIATFTSSCRRLVSSSADRRTRRVDEERSRAAMPPRHMGSPRPRSPVSSAEGGRRAAWQRPAERARRSRRRKLCPRGPAIATRVSAMVSRTTPSRPTAIQPRGRSKRRKGSSIAKVSSSRRSNGATTAQPSGTRNRRRASAYAPLAARARTGGTRSSPRKIAHESRTRAS